MAAPVDESFRRCRRRARQGAGDRERSARMVRSEPASCRASGHGWPLPSTNRSGNVAVAPARAPATVSAAPGWCGANQLGTAQGNAAWFGSDAEQAADAGADARCAVDFEGSADAGRSLPHADDAVRVESSGAPDGEALAVVGH